jgi:inhibitor of KinA
MSEASHSVKKYPRILPAGDQALMVEFGNEISPSVNDDVYALADRLSVESPSWLGEIVPTYRSLLIAYDGFQFDYDRVYRELSEFLSADTGNNVGTVRSPVVFELPVAYGGQDGPDLAQVAEHAGLTVEEVVSIHTSVSYRVYMIGFSPGFPYLGGMDTRIACPRLGTPRTRVPAGSVGIAESQTGVYPNASPGGWQLIGRTPVRLFDVTAEPPSLLQPGHFVRFVPVSIDQMVEIEREIDQGNYRVETAELSE